MNELMGNDVYEIKANYSIDRLQQRTVTLLYQPLIGYEAVSLYFALWAELDILSLTSSSCHHLRITKLTGMSLTSIQSSLKKLEAIGLLNTYRKEGQEVRYLYELMLPLTPSKFLTHQILNTLLYKILGKQEYQRTIVCFKVATVDKTKYTNITAKFSDVFSINLMQEVSRPVLVEQDSLTMETNILEREYPLELFYAGLADYQIKKNAITKDDEAIIQQLGMLYKINAIDMQRLVKEAMFEDVLDHKILIKECRIYFDIKMPSTFNEIHHKQSIKHKSVAGSASIDSHVKYLESVSPYKLLKDKQGGREPVKKDLMIIESVLTTLNLEPGVVNVLIEMALSQCDNSLTRGYMEHYGSKWKRKKICTVSGAIQEAKESIKNKKDNTYSWQDVKEKQEVFQEVNENTINEERFKEILAKYE